MKCPSCSNQALRLIQVFQVDVTGYGEFMWSNKYHTSLGRDEVLIRAARNPDNKGLEITVSRNPVDQYYCCDECDHAERKGA